MRDDTLTAARDSSGTGVKASILPDSATHVTNGTTKADAAVVRLLAKGEAPLVVIIGADALEFLDALDRRSPSTKVLIVEPEVRAAERLLARPDARNRASAGRLAVVAGPDYAGAPNAFRFFPKGVLLPPVIVAPETPRRVGAEALAGAKAAVGRILAGVRANDEARRQFAGRYLLNTLGNLPFITAEGDAAALADLFTGIPAIVVGAGPSLDRQIEALRALRERAIVIAVDTACRPLLAAGIHPHMVVAVDPTALNAQHLLDLPDTRGIWFVAEGSIDGSVFPQFAQRTFTFKVSDHHPWPLLAAHGADRGTLRAWGSVLTTAFDLAVHAGCNPIVFAGADLAYTDGLRYCRNTIHEAEWRDYPTDAARAEQFKPVLEARPHVIERDVHGRPTTSTPLFLQFRDWLRAQSPAIDRQVINATGAGVLHGGAIALRDIDTLDFAARADHQQDVQAHLHAAWTRSSATRDTVQASLERALSYGSAVPLDEWFDFAGDDTPRAQIVDAATAAASALAERRKVAGYLARQRDSYDRRIRTLDDARELSHGNYERAARRAATEQAHALVEFNERTYETDAPGLEATLGGVSAMPRGRRALDVGCGVGRLMEPLVAAGWRVDGVDISARMLDFARQSPALAASTFFQGGGEDCGAALDGAYDLAYSRICFRYIQSRRVRQSLLRAMARALRPGGVVMVELRFFPTQSATQVGHPHVPWSGECLEQTAEALAADVRPTPDELHFVYQDFTRHFNDVRLQIVDMPPAVRDTHPPCLIVSGATSASLAPRIHAAR